MRPILRDTSNICPIPGDTDNMSPTHQGKGRPVPNSSRLERVSATSRRGVVALGTVTVRRRRHMGRETG